MPTVVEASPAAARELLGLAEQLERHSGFADVLASLAARSWRDARRSLGIFVRARGGGPRTACLAAAGGGAAAHSRSRFAVRRSCRSSPRHAPQQFPAWETDAGERVLNDEIYGQRLRVLKSLRFATDGRKPRIIVTAIQSLMQPVPSAETLAAATRRIKVGDTLDTAEFTRWLGRRKVARAPRRWNWPASSRSRGGILDLFPPDAEHPIRVELFGDEVESLRTFDVATQRSLESLDAVDITVLQPDTRESHALHRLFATGKLVPAGRTERTARRRSSSTTSGSNIRRISSRRR